MKPLQVYLDSADFSHAADHVYCNRNPEFVTAWDSLRRMCTDGDVVCRFSVVHICEITHLTPDSKPAAMRRANALKEMCGSHALRFATELAPLDGLAFVNHAKAGGQGVIDRSYAWADEGEWLPLAIMEIGDLRENALRQLRDAIKALPLSPNKRREALAKIFHGNHLSPYAIELVKNQPQAGLAAFEREFPLTERFHREKMYLGLVEGRVNQQEFAREIYQALVDPVQYVSWCFDKYDTEKVTTTAIRDHGKRMVSEIESVRVKVNALRSAGHAAGLDDDAVRAKVRDFPLPTGEMRTKQLRQLYTDNSQQLRAQGVSKTEWDRLVVPSVLGSMPATDLYLDLLEAHFRQNIEFSDEGYYRKLRGSDGADLLHAMYLPYVDFFRADGYAADLLAKLACGKKHRVCSSLPALIAKLDKEIAARGKPSIHE